MSRDFDATLPKCHGECVLRNPLAAQAVIEELLGFPPDVCLPIALAVMPNHVHLVARFFEVRLDHIMKSIKGRSSRRINQILGRSGSLWQREYFDRAIRDERHLAAAVHYVEWNPVKDGLVIDPREYAFCSASPHVAMRLARLHGQVED